MENNNTENVMLKKLDYIRLLAQFYESGHVLEKNYSMNDSLNDLETAYLLEKTKFEFSGKAVAPSTKYNVNFAESYYELQNVDKIACLKQLEELVKTTGVKLSKNYSMNDSLESMKLELSLHLSVKTHQSKICKNLLAHGPEMVNDQFNPFDLKFDDLTDDKLDDVYESDNSGDNKLDNAYESDDDVNDIFNNGQYAKLNYLRKLGELAQAGVKLSQNYSINNTLEELDHAYKFNFEIFKHQLIEKNVNLVRHFFIEHDLQYYVDNWMHTGMCAYQLLVKDGTIKYVIKYDQELWTQLTKIVLYFLRSDIPQKFIEIGFQWLESNINTYTTHINSFKQLILTSDENTFVKIKKTTMEQNYKFIQALTHDDEIKHENRQEIIKLLIKINSIIAEIKETTDELLEQINELFNSNEKIMEFAKQIKNFIQANLDCVIKDDVFYYKYIIPNIEKKYVK